MLTIREILVNSKYQVLCRKDTCQLETSDKPQIYADCDDNIFQLQIAEVGTVNFDFKDRNIGINLSDNCDEANIINPTKKEQFKILEFVKDSDDTSYIIKYKVIIYELTYNMFKFRILKTRGESEFIMDVYVYRVDEDKRRDSDSNPKTSN